MKLRTNTHRKMNMQMKLNMTIKGKMTMNRNVHLKMKLNMKMMMNMNVKIKLNNDAAHGNEMLSICWVRRRLDQSRGAGQGPLNEGPENLLAGWS
jgi:hypothetical protein